MNSGRDPAAVVMGYFKHVFHALQQQRAADWVDGELTLAQLRAFLTIAHKPGMSVGGVGRELGIGLPAASHIVDRLVQAGLVERRPHPHDRRVTLVGLSPAGERLWERVESFGPGLIRRWLSELTREELHALEFGLRGMVRVIDRGREPAARQGGASE